MCIILVAIMLLLYFYFAGDMAQFQLVELVGDDQVVIAESWQVLSTLWPVLLFVFLTGILFVVLVMKFLPKSNSNSD